MTDVPTHNVGDEGDDVRPVSEPLGTGWARVLDVMCMVAADCDSDVMLYEGAPFTGENVAKQLGEIRAQIQACAIAIEKLVRARIDEEATP